MDLNGNGARPEIVIGLVAPVGVDLTSVESILTDLLKQFGYNTNSIHLSSLLHLIGNLETSLLDKSEYERIDTHMTAGDELREKTGRGNFLAALAISAIHRERKEEEPSNYTAHIFNSLKHPDEVELLRTVYGDGFYLLGVTSSRSKRQKYLTEQKGIRLEQAKYLMSRDESESFKFGQHMRDAFHLADGFINMDVNEPNIQIGRILDLIFGKPCVTPTREEYAMYLAFAASLRSGDLSRQVGAVISCSNHDVIATGANDVPCFGGGLYWTSDGTNDARDYVNGYDVNESRKNEIIIKIMQLIEPDEKEPEKLLEKGKQQLKDTGIVDITEYGRAVHAEMEALLCCARSGISPRNGTLYTTTFPCHNCAKHIVASGIIRVVFVEPYPKSLAADLHKDSIYLSHECEEEVTSNKLCFEPFIGIGPRRFMDLFSMTLGSGKKAKRKINGKLLQWERSSASIRSPLLPMSYIDREAVVEGGIDLFMEEIHVD